MIKINKLIPTTLVAFAVLAGGLFISRASVSASVAVPPAAPDFSTFRFTDSMGEPTPADTLTCDGTAGPEDYENVIPSETYHGTKILWSHWENDPTVRYGIDTFAPNGTRMHHSSTIKPHFYRFYGFGTQGNGIYTMKVHAQDKVTGLKSATTTCKLAFVQTPEANESKFLANIKFVRPNNGGDITAQVLVPEDAVEVRFTYTDNADSNNVYTGGASEHIQPPQFPNSSGQHQYRGKKSLPEAIYTTTGEFRIFGKWFPITGSATTYGLSATGDFVIPTNDNPAFQLGENPATITSNDNYNSFRKVIFTLDGNEYLVNRADCDLSNAGVTVTCDVDQSSTWSPLALGSHTVSAKIYNQANSRRELSDRNFTVENSTPSARVLNEGNSKSNDNDKQVLVNENDEKSNSEESTSEDKKDSSKEEIVTESKSETITPEVKDAKSEIFSKEEVSTERTER